MTTQELLARARQARGAMALADTQTKDRALLAMAEELEADTAPILAANALDLELPATSPAAKTDLLRSDSTHLSANRIVRRRKPTLPTAPDKKT